MCYSDGGPLLNQKDAVWVPIPAEVSVGVRREGAEREEKTPQFFRRGLIRNKRRTFEGSYTLKEPRKTESTDTTTVPLGKLKLLCLKEEKTTREGEDLYPNII